MPIFRYFIFVGGALFALLFAADFVWPTLPVGQEVATGAYDQPLIRIRSDRHLPERVVLDTSQPTVPAPVVNTADVAAPRPAAQADPLADISAKARVRETFAQFGPNADGAAAARLDAKAQGRAQATPTTQPPLVQVPVQPKRKVARAHPAPQRGQPMRVAQQPHFGLFDTTW